MLTLFFDLDGVLSDFVRGALKFHGREDVHPSRVEWGIEAQLGMRPAEFWAPLGYGFWSSLEPYPDGMALLAAAEKLVSPERIALLTSPCDTAGCVDGKRDWVARHLPAYTRRLFVGSAKHLFAAPTKLLIDDNDENCRRFESAGGRTVQPPRPWNVHRAQCDAEGGFSVARVFEALQAELRLARAAA